MSGTRALYFARRGQDSGEKFMVMGAGLRVGGTAFLAVLLSKALLISSLRLYCERHDAINVRSIIASRDSYILLFL